jgi:hypothetical protein
MSHTNFDDLINDWYNTTVLDVIGVQFVSNESDT